MRTLVLAFLVWGCSSTNTPSGTTDSGTPGAEGGAQKRDESTDKEEEDTGATKGEYALCPEGITPSFASINELLLQPACASCHVKNYERAGRVFPDGAGGLSFKGEGAHAALRAARANNAGGRDRRTFTKIIVPGDPDASFLVKKLSMTEQSEAFGSGMPPKTPGSICPETLNAIRAWIEGGAEDN